MMSGTGEFLVVDICPFRMNPFDMRSNVYVSDWHDGVFDIK